MSRRRVRWESRCRSGTWVHGLSESGSHVLCRLIESHSAVRDATGLKEPLWRRLMALLMLSCPGVRLPPSNGWDNRHLVPIRQHRLLASHKADIFIIEIEIHELPNRSPLIAQLFSEPGEMASQLIQHVLDRCPCDFDFTL